MLIENELATKIIGSAIEVHRILGPGLLESTYRESLFHELQLRHLNVKREHSLPLVYKDLTVNSAFRLDLCVEDKVIIELKAVESLNDVHAAQTLTYLKITGCKLGLLINFNVAFLRNGIKRIANGL